MHYDHNSHHRKSIRLNDYDYSQEGIYFVTICTKNMECVFGDVVDGEMVLNEYAHEVSETVRDLLVEAKHKNDFLSFNLTEISLKPIRMPEQRVRSARITPPTYRRLGLRTSSSSPILDNLSSFALPRGSRLL